MTRAEIIAEIATLETERNNNPTRKTGHGMNPWIREDAKRPQYISHREMELRWALIFGRLDD